MGELLPVQPTKLAMKQVAVAGAEDPDPVDGFFRQASRKRMGDKCHRMTRRGHPFEDFLKMDFCAAGFWISYAPPVDSQNIHAKTYAKKPGFSTADIAYPVYQERFTMRSRNEPELSKKISP
jgi:hypothetical protein